MMGQFFRAIGRRFGIRTVFITRSAPRDLAELKRREAATTAALRAYVDAGRRA